MTAQYHLTVLGDRQSGKSRLLLSEGLRDAQAGLVVLYTAESVPMAEVRFDDAATMMYGQCLRACRSTRVITFESGGLIAFRAETQWSDDAIYERRIDTHLIDNCGFTSPYPSASRVIRAVVR